MIPLRVVIVSLTTALLALTVLIGLLARRKVRACVSFPVYLGIGAGGHLLVAGAPMHFWTWEFWAAAHAVQGTLALGIAFEIAYKTFQPLPRGYRRVGLLMALLMLIMAPAAAFVPRHVGDAYDLFLSMAPVRYWTGALFLVYLLAVRYWGIPIDPLHRTIATGFGIVAVIVGCATLLWQFDPVFGLGRDLIATTTYPLVLGWWAVAAWRRDSFSEFSPETMRRLFPWRVG